MVANESPSNAVNPHNTPLDLPPSTIRKKAATLANDMSMSNILNGDMSLATQIPAKKHRLRLNSFLKYA